MKYIIVAAMLFGCGDMRPPVQPPTVDDTCKEIADMFIERWVDCYDSSFKAFSPEFRKEYIHDWYYNVRKDAVKYCIDKTVRRETLPNPTRCRSELLNSHCYDAITLWSTWVDWCWEDVK